MIENSYKCSLFNCKSEKKLAEYLIIKYPKEYKETKQILQNNPISFYINYSKVINNKEREIFECKKKIKHIHNRLKKLFSNLEKKDYLKSGIKKQSYITNAKRHSYNNFFLLIDIKNFYPSITQEYIKNKLIITYKQSSDVAEFISNAVTISQKKSDNKRSLVTGSPLSQYFSYVINKKMFDELEKISKENNIIFSVYVDDISFSSKEIITYKFLKRVFYIIKKNKFYIGKNKKFYRGKISSKSIITGVLLTKYGLFGTEKNKTKIRAKIENLKILEKDSIEYKEQYKSLIFSIQQLVHINKGYKKYLNLIKEHFSNFEYKT